MTGWARALVAAAAVAAASPALADRYGIDEAGESGSAPGWVVALLFAGAAYWAWRDGEKRVADARKVQHYCEQRERKARDDLELERLIHGHLQVVVQRYIDGELTDEEFFEQADALLKKPLAKRS